jgi:hypothetical protein
MLVARCTAAFALSGIVVVVVFDGACATYACPGSVPADQPAIFDLSCGPTDVVNIGLSGACSTGDASSSADVFGATSASVAVSSPNPGVCHVVLTFATGFNYSADVTFLSQTDSPPPGCPVSHYTAPTQRTFTVNNPSNTCVDAGLDEGADAAGDAATCPSTASQGVACNFLGSCTGCRLNVRFECSCSDADASSSEAGGLQWQCIDTGMPCTSGGP